MIKSKHAIIGACLTILLFPLTGCSTNETNTQNASRTTSQAIKQATITHADGAIISLTAIAVPNTIGVNTYKLMYWSDNTETEAFIAVPKAAGQYPLLVECHGGYPVPMNETHQYTYGLNASALSGASSHEIMLIPQYRGYGGSNGTVHGLYGDTLDANNAINAYSGAIRPPVPENIGRAFRN